MDTKNILNLIKYKHFVLRYTILCIGLFISAAVFNLFLLPRQFVSGGSSGVSIIFHSVFGFDASVVVLVVSVICLIFSFIFLGIEKTSATIVSTFLFPFFIKVTSHLGNVIDVTSASNLLIAVFAGLIGGVSNGIICRTGYSSGGLNVISMILFKYFKMSVSKTTFYINSILVFAGGVYFGWTNVMYALIVLYINGIINDRILIGISKNKSIHIVTNKLEEIKDYVIKELGFGCTILKATGGFLKNHDRVLFCVIPTSKYYLLKEGIEEIDESAFFVVTDAYQTSNYF